MANTNIGFAQLADGFGVVTVMNACIYKLREGRSYVGRGACAHARTAGGALTKDDFVCTGLYLDTLKIANLTMEGPTKTVTGGQYANPLIKYGKTMTAEMQDALGRVGTLVEFFGCDYVGDKDKGRISVTDKFPGAFAIEGDTFFIDQRSGEKVDVHIFIPQFLPDGIFNLTQDAEGDATVFDLNGTISVTRIKDGDDEEPRDIFYEIRENPFFYNMTEDGAVDESSATPKASEVNTNKTEYVGYDYHDNNITEVKPLTETQEDPAEGSET